MRFMIFLALLAALACDGRSGDSYSIGAAGPWKQGYGAMSRRGIDLAVEEINARGGIKGRKLHVYSEDDNGDGIRAAAIADRFVRNPRIVAVVGHVNSGGMLAAAPVYDEGGLTALATSASSPELTGISPWVFRVISSDSLNAAILARFTAALAPGADGRTSASILFENNSYGRGLADAFRRSFQGNILSTDPIDADIRDPEPFISYLKMRNPSVVFVAGRVPSALKLLREAQRQGFTARFIGGDGWQGIVEDTAASEGAFVGTSFIPANAQPQVQKFVAAFRKRFNSLPDAHAALAYDATHLIAAAIASRGNDRTAIRQYLASLSETGAYTGVTGKTLFDVNGDPTGMGFTVARIQGGRMVPTGQQ